jgi:hypothetical protein
METRFEWKKPKIELLAPFYILLKSLRANAQVQVREQSAVCGRRALTQLHRATLTSFEALATTPTAMPIERQIIKKVAERSP